MKKFILSLLAMIFLISFANADGNISACGLIDASGTYTLINNLVGEGDSCINIDANDVIFDGNGYYIDGNETFGNLAIDITNVMNVTIKNLLISSNT